MLLEPFTPGEAKVWQRIKNRGEEKFRSRCIQRVIFPLIAIACVLLTPKAMNWKAPSAFYFGDEVVLFLITVGYGASAPGRWILSPRAAWENGELQFALADGATVSRLPASWLAMTQRRSFFHAIVFPVSLWFAWIAWSPVDGLGFMTWVALLFVILAFWAGRTLWAGGAAIDRQRGVVRVWKGFPIALHSREVPLASITSVIVADGKKPARPSSTWRCVAIVTEGSKVVVKIDDYRPSLEKFARELRSELSLSWDAAKTDAVLQS